MNCWMISFFVSGRHAEKGTNFSSFRNNINIIHNLSNRELFVQHLCNDNPENLFRTPKRIETSHPFSVSYITRYRCLFRRQRRSFSFCISNAFSSRHVPPFTQSCFTTFEIGTRKSTKQIIQIENYRKQKQCVKQRPKLSPPKKNRTCAREEIEKRVQPCTTCTTAKWMPKLDAMFADSFAEREKNCICMNCNLFPTRTKATRSRKNFALANESKAHPKRMQKSCPSCGIRAIDHRDSEPANWN